MAYYFHTVIRIQSLMILGKNMTHITKTSNKKPTQIWVLLLHLGVSKVHWGWQGRAAIVHIAVMPLIWNLMCADWQVGEHVHWTQLCGFQSDWEPCVTMLTADGGSARGHIPLLILKNPTGLQWERWLNWNASLHTPGSCCYHRHLPILSAFTLSELLCPSPKQTFWLYYTKTKQTTTISSC